MLLLIFFFLLIGLGSMVVWIWALIDAATRPEWVFDRARSNKVMWIILIVVLGAIPAAIYMFAVRPRLIAVQSGAQVGGWSPGYGGPAAGWYPDPSGRHHMRYWDGTVWTGSVSDGGAAMQDPLFR